jgi:hypothetical protein
MSKLVLIMLAVAIGFSFFSCSTTKTKADCVKECQDRGAEYVGIVPKGRLKENQYGATEDICQCK